MIPSSPLRRPVATLGRAAALVGVFLAAALLAPNGARAQASTAGMPYMCPATCTLPTCHCASLEPPGGLPRSETPQFVLVTFDDAIQTRIEDDAVELMMRGIRNPGGRPVHRTYFAQSIWTNIPAAQRVLAAGHEIANHTLHHTTSVNSTEEEWTRQLDGLDAFMRDTVGVPAGKVVGMRAPFLATNDAMWNVLARRRGMLYESSLTEVFDTQAPMSRGVDRMIWPHTLDGGSATNCVTSNCPRRSVPGLWSVPMWALYSNVNGRMVGQMDPHQSLDSTSLYNLLMYNFEARYRGNRAPLGLFLHAGRIRRKDDAIAGYNRFLREITSRGDVWIVTMRGLVEWMRRPVPLSRMGVWIDSGAATGTLVGVADEGRPGAPTLVVGPNPTRGRAVVHRATGGEAADLDVFDALGRRVFSRPVAAGETTAEVVLDGQAPGLYVVRLGRERTTLVVTR